MSESTNTQDHGTKRRSDEPTESSPPNRKHARIDTKTDPIRGLDDPDADGDNVVQGATGTTPTLGSNGTVLIYVGKAERDKDKIDPESRATEFRVVYQSYVVAIKKETLKSSELFATRFALVPEAVSWTLPVTVDGCTPDRFVRYFELLCLLEESTFGHLGDEKATFDCSFYLKFGTDWKQTQTLFRLAAYFGHATMLGMAKKAWWYYAPWASANQKDLDSAVLHKQLKEAAEFVRHGFSKEEKRVFLGWIHWSNRYTFSPPTVYNPGHNHYSHSWIAPTDLAKGELVDLWESGESLCPWL
jgi:hypothetical protein